MKRWLVRLWRSIRHFRSNADIEDELRVHLEMLKEEGVDAGTAPEQARRLAHLRLGTTHSVIERVRDQEFITAVEGCYRDFAMGLRALRRSPVFCLTAILTLALGIGANTAIFSLLYGLLLRSLPVHNAGDLVRLSLIRSDMREQASGSYIPYQMLQGLRRIQHSYTDISAWRFGIVTMQDGEGDVRMYNSLLVSGNAFEVLGIAPHLGRLIAPSDDVRGGPPGGWPVVLSYGFWKERFGGDPQIVGKQIRLSNSVVSVIGVGPADFNGVQPGFDFKMYLPLHYLAVQDPVNIDAPTSFFFCSAIGRLRPGGSLESAAAELKVQQKHLLDEFIPKPLRHATAFEHATLQVDSARTGFPSLFGRLYSQPLYLMQGLVAAVLLLCCINVAGLLMSNVYARRREFAVRTAMGAGRWRLVRQYLMESFVLAVAGAALGAAATWYGNSFLLHFFRDPNMGEWMSIPPDKTIFLVTAGFAVLTTLFFGAFPAWNAGRSDADALLKSRTPTAAKRHFAGRAFVPMQVALSLVLVTLAMLLSESLVRLRGEYTGFDVAHVTIQTPPFHLLRLAGDAKLDLYQRMVDRMEQQPGIHAAAVTWITPMTGFQATASFESLTNTPNSSGDLRLAFNEVGPGYFRTMNTRIVQGREFDRSERRREVCILNQSAASALFPHQVAIGRYVRTKDPNQFPKDLTCRVIGVAEDAKFATLREAPPRTLYFPVSDDNIRRGNLVFLMNSGTKAEAVAGYRKALAEIIPTMPVVLFATLQEQMDAALGSQRAITFLSDVFGACALFLSAIGLYGLLSSLVTQRTAEIGVRMAIGAPRASVVRLILAEALRLFGAGLVAGAVALFFAVRLITNMLYGASAADPRTLLATTVLLALVALLAGLPPALRAASVDPIEALRAE